METNDDGRWDVCDHPMWLHPIFAYIKAHQEELKVGVTGLAMQTLRAVETEDHLQEPAMEVGSRGNLKLTWEFAAGATFILDFLNFMEFRYRYDSAREDTGVVFINRCHIEHIRRIFRKVFNTNHVTEQSMVFHLGKRFPG